MRLKSIVFATVLCTSANLSANPSLLTIKSAHIVAFHEPDHQPSMCGSGTEVLLQNGDLTGPIASLSEFVEGICEIYILPNPRTFPLVGESMGCGSIMWKGTLITDNGWTAIEIADHRLRRCDDIVVSPIVIQEHLADGKVITKYGMDAEDYYSRPRPAK